MHGGEPHACRVSERGSSVHQDVNDGVDEHHSDAKNQDDPLDHWVVTSQERANQELPSPGRAKTFSTTTALPTTLAKSKPPTVSAAVSTFGSPCRR